VRPVVVGEICGDKNVTPILAGKFDRAPEARQVAVGYEHDRRLDPLGIADFTDDARDLGGAAGDGKSRSMRRPSRALTSVSGTPGRAGGPAEGT